MMRAGLSTKVKQMAVYELSKLLPKNLRPLPLELFRINDTRSDIVPNSGPPNSLAFVPCLCQPVLGAPPNLYLTFACKRFCFLGTAGEVYTDSTAGWCHSEMLGACTLRKLSPELRRLSPGPTWSSTGSESACAAVQEACKQLVKSLSEAAKGVEADEAAAFWKAAVTKVHSQVGYVPAAAALSAVGFYDGTDREGGVRQLATHLS